MNRKREFKSLFTFSLIFLILSISFMLLLFIKFPGYLESMKIALLFNFILFGISIFGLIISSIVLANCKKHENALIKDEITDIGKIKIEYINNGNVIRVYNSPEVCSLVINGKVIDEYRGLVAKKFVLHGHLNIEGKEVSVRLEMNGFFLYLYYDNIKVGKKFIAFG